MTIAGIKNMSIFLTTLLSTSRSILLASSPKTSSATTGSLVFNLIVATTRARYVQGKRPQQNTQSLSNFAASQKREDR